MATENKPNSNSTAKSSSSPRRSRRLELASPRLFLPLPPPSPSSSSSPCRSRRIELASPCLLLPPPPSPYGRNLSTFFQLPPHLSSSSLRTAGPMAANAARAAHSLDAANSASGLSARQVASSLPRSAAASPPEFSTTPTRWPGSSSMENARGAFSLAMDPPPPPPPPEALRRLLVPDRSEPSKDPAARVEMAPGSVSGERQRRGGVQVLGMNQIEQLRLSLSSSERAHRWRAGGGSSSSGGPRLERGVCRHEASGGHRRRIA